MSRPSATEPEGEAGASPTRAASAALAAASEPADLGALLAGYERSLILAALAAVGGRQRSAAGLLRILPSTLSEKMKRLGMRPQRAARRLVPPSGTPASASLHWSGRVLPGGILEVRGLNGPVRVEGTADALVEVLAVRKGPCELLASLEVKVIEHGRGVTVCSLWQGPERPASRRAERRLARGVADVSVEITARVPLGVRVVAATINGDIEVVGLAGPVEAATANGRVRFLPSSAPLAAAAATKLS